MVALKGLEEMKHFYSISPDMYARNKDFFDYVVDKITTSQYRDILKIEKAIDVLYYLVYAYNCYTLSNNYGRSKLITNPEKLFNHGVEEETFLLIFLNYVRDEIAETVAMKNLRNSSTKAQE